MYRGKFSPAKRGDDARRSKEFLVRHRKLFISARRERRKFPDVIALTQSILPQDAAHNEKQAEAKWSGASFACHVSAIRRCFTPVLPKAIRPDRS